MTQCVPAPAWSGWACDTFETSATIAGQDLDVTVHYSGSAEHYRGRATGAVEVTIKRIVWEDDAGGEFSVTPSEFAALAGTEELARIVSEIEAHEWGNL